MLVGFVVSEFMPNVSLSECMPNVSGVRGI